MYQQHGIKRKQWTQELKKQKLLKDKQKILDYRTQTNKILNEKEAHVYTQDALKETSCLLVLNPEFNTIWNYRRDIITNLRDSLDSKFWDDELIFTMAQLKNYPKVYWIWNHRVWTLNNYPDSPVHIWKMELGIVSKLLQIDARNFHGWHYRRFIVQKLEQLNEKSMDKEEFAYATENINKNISNYSGWHQRAKLIPKMFEKGEVDDKKKFINDEVSYVTNAMFTDAEDQSVWFYIKWFIKSEIVSSTLTKDEYIQLIKKLKQNIIVINQDDLDFSGKNNNWCLKILIVIDDIENGHGLDFQSNSKKYLKTLIEADPLRKNRYEYLLNKS